MTPEQTVVAALLVFGAVIGIGILVKKKKSAPQMRLAKGVNDQGYYPIPAVCYEESPACMSLTGDAYLACATEEYNKCIQRDCSAQCTIDCLDEGFCSCSEFETITDVDPKTGYEYSYQVCKTISPPADNPDVIQKCSDRCYSDYSTDFRPLRASKDLLKQRMKNSKKNKCRAYEALMYQCRQTEDKGICDKAMALAKQCKK